MKNQFTEKFKNLLITKNVSQKEFADKMKVNIVVVNRWYNGKAMPTTKSISKICRFFGVSPSYFYDEDDLVEKVYEATNNSHRIDLLEEKIKRIEVEIENLKLRGK